MSPFEQLVCVALIFCSAYMSASETALFSLSRFQLRHLKENFRPAHRKIKRLLGDPGGLLITILVCNEMVNIAISTLFAGAIARNWKPTHKWMVKNLPSSWLEAVPPWAMQMALGILITTPILLFLCEITPKGIGARMNQVVAPLSAGPMLWIYEGMRPVRSVLKRLISLVSRLLGQEDPHRHDAETGDKTLLKEDEFMLMIEEGHKEGAIHSSELGMIRNVLNLDDVTVEEAYTPITQVHSLSMHTTIKGALTFIHQNRFSRIPITGPSRRDIVGILYAKDLLRAKLETPGSMTTISTIMRKPLSVNPTMRLNTLFRKFKQSKTHIAIVQKDSGEALGIVTMDDVLDILFEDLYAEETRG